MMFITSYEVQEQLQQMQRQREMLLQQQPMLGQLHPMFAPPMTYMPVLGVVPSPPELSFLCWPDRRH